MVAFKSRPFVGMFIKYLSLGLMRLYGEHVHCKCFESEKCDARDSEIALK